MRWRPALMEINGIAHIIVTVSRFDECKAFYRRLLPFLGLGKIVQDRKDYFYCIGGRTGFGISRAADQHRQERCDQTRPGLHHVCFRARSRDDVVQYGGWLRNSAPESFVRRKKGIGRRAIIRPCSKIRMVFGWKLITFRAKAYLLPI
jgi:catechol 2,3-dioxygenase-like lactoylglutathione lyase family enzyme